MWVSMCVCWIRAGRPSLWLDPVTGLGSRTWAQCWPIPESCCQLPRPLSARPALPCPALPSPPGWLRAWSRWDLSALPSFVCLSFLPSQPLSVLCFIMPWGEPGPARLPAVHPWEAAREQACLRGPQLCGHPFPCLATPVAPAWPFPSPTVHCQPPS